MRFPSMLNAGLDTSSSWPRSGLTMLSPSGLNQKAALDTAASWLRFRHGAIQCTSQGSARSDKSSNSCDHLEVIAGPSSIAPITSLTE